MEEENKVLVDSNKPKEDDKVSERREKKSRDREREEKKSKKHKKRRSSSPSSSSDGSRSESKTRSRSSKRSKHKKHRSSKRSSSRSKKRSSSRSRKHRSHRRSSRSRDRSRSKSKDRRDNRDRDRRDRDRDRERDSRKRRSPSKEKRKDKKSKEKEKRGGGGGGSFKFDSPPKDMQMTEESINFAALGIPNLEALKEMYPSLKNMDPSELINKLKLIEDMKHLQASKVDRKLYIGNIPAGITPQTLMDLLNSALQKMGINADPPGNSIIGAWISPDNHYAFVDFRTPEEATNGFALNSVAIHGQTLKVGRPRSYQQTQAVENPLQALLGSAGLPLNPLGMLGQGEGTMSTTTTKIQPPSRILVLKNMIKVSELEIDEEFQDIFEDVKEECEKYGKVLSMKIPRPEQGKTVPGLGKILVEYATLDEAKAARKELHGRTYDENTIEISYYDEEKYAANDLSEM